MMIDNITNDLLKDLYNADSEDVQTVLDVLNYEKEQNSTIYENEDGTPTRAGIILFELQEMLFVHGLWKRDKSFYLQNSDTN